MRFHSPQETGNRMTERNLATILGPNILHKELKVCVEIEYGGWGEKWRERKRSKGKEKEGREGEGRGVLGHIPLIPT